MGGLPSGIITLLTDFGVQDAYTGIMKGVMLSLCSRLTLVDLTHQVPPQDVATAGLLLWSALDYFPQGTVHLAVVDPGVGGARRPLAIQTDQAFLVGPDNGLFSMALQGRPPLRCHQISNPAIILDNPRGHTFHGRDIFAPAAAHLAMGTAIQELGPETPPPLTLPLPQPQPLPSGQKGQIIHADRFGNLITNIKGSPEALNAQILGHTVPLVPSYDAVAPGALLAIINSLGLVEIALRNGSAAALLEAGPGTEVLVLHGQETGR